MHPANPLSKFRIRPLQWHPTNRQRLLVPNAVVQVRAPGKLVLEFTIEIRIAAGPYIVFELFDTRAIRAGLSSEIPIGVLKLGPMSADRSALGGLPTYTFHLSFASHVPPSMVAGWLYERIQGRAYPLRMAINGIETAATQKAITRSIERSLAPLHEAAVARLLMEPRTPAPRGVGRGRSTGRKRSALTESVRSL